MILDLFSLKGKTAIVTGGEGLLGKMMCQTIRELGGTAISVDIKTSADIECDITNPLEVNHLAREVPKLDILINNAVGNQKPVTNWHDGWIGDMRIGMKGQIEMLRSFEPHLKASKGVVLNMGSDMALIAPDQSLYPEGTVKPMSYSVIKHGMVGLTRYLAALWGGQVRVNCLCPGGVQQGQKIPRCPMNRLAELHEMSGPVAFLISDASSYMTGAILSVDGGRTAI